MKRTISSLTILFALIMGLVLPAAVAIAAGPNLINNADVETVGSSASLPSGWQTGRWGTNTASFSYDTGIAASGSRSLTAQITSYTNGDAKWYFTPVTVTPNTQYTFGDSYISNVASQWTAQYTSTTGTVSYVDLKSLPAAATWTAASVSFTTPANVSKMTVFHLINRVGKVQTDNFSLSTAGTVTPPPVSTVSITVPSAGSTVSGTATTVSATATDSAGVAGVTFKVDGVVIGAEDTTSPYSVNWDTTSVANGSHSLTAVMRNSNGATTTSSGVSINVQNVVTPPPAANNLLPNPSFETANASNPNLPANWASSSWGSNSTTFSYLNTGRTGSRSVGISMSNTSSGDAKWLHPAQSVIPGQVYQYTDYYISDVTTEIDAMVTLTNGTVAYYYAGTASASATWTKASVQFTAPANASSIVFMHILYTNGSLKIDDASFTAYTPASFNRALVSLTFDDAWRTIYTNGLPLLQKYNFKSTQYLLTGTINDSQYMTPTMMVAFRDAGHEIASHTVTHPHLPTLSAVQLDYELRQSQASLRTWTGQAVTNFASPYGEYNATVITNVQKYYRSHRSVDAGYNSKDNFNIWGLKVQNIINTTTTAEVQQWVNQAVKDKTWLILVYHQVSPSTTEVYNTTPTQLDSHFTVIKNSGIGVVTVEQALNEISPQL